MSVLNVNAQKKKPKKQKHNNPELLIYFCRVISSSRETNNYWENQHTLICEVTFFPHQERNTHVVISIIWNRSYQSILSKNIEIFVQQLNHFIHLQNTDFSSMLLLLLFLQSIWPK